MAEWLAEVLRPISDPSVVAAVAALSLLSTVAALLGAPWFAARLPRDLLTRAEPRPPRARAFAGGPLRVLFALARNALGALLVLAGVAMLLLPGQGLLTLLVGLLVMDFPGKRGALRAILARPRVFSTVNALRRRAGRPELEPPASAARAPAAEGAAAEDRNP